MDDPLRRDPSTWQPADLQSLKGRREGQRLECKGSAIDITKKPGREMIAAAVAGMQSSDGGYVIVGAEETGGFLQGFSGLAVSNDQVANLRRSLLDSVYPQPTLSVHALPGDQPNRIVIAVHIQPHPLGLPALFDGRFYTRIADETRPMNFDEVARRFRSADEASTRAASKITIALENRRRDFETPEMVKPCFQVAAIPLFGMPDWGMTGSRLLDVLEEVIKSEVHLWNETYAGSLAQFGPTFASRLTTSNGVAITGMQWSWQVAHDGLSTVLMNAALSFSPNLRPSHLEIDVIGALAARLGGLSLAVHRGAGIGGPAYLHLDTGGLNALVESDGPGLKISEFSTPHSVAYSFTAPIWGATAESLAAGIELFCQRVIDGLGAGRWDLGTLTKVRTYLSRLFE